MSSLKDYLKKAKEFKMGDRFDQLLLKCIPDIEDIPILENNFGQFLAKIAECDVSSFKNKQSMNAGFKLLEESEAFQKYLKTESRTQSAEATEVKKLQSDYSLLQQLVFEMSNAFQDVWAHNTETLAAFQSSLSSLEKKLRRQTESKSTTLDQAVLHNMTTLKALSLTERPETKKETELTVELQQMKEALRKERLAHQETRDRLALNQTQFDSTSADLDFPSIHQQPVAPTNPAASDNRPASQNLRVGMLLVEKILPNQTQRQPSKQKNTGKFAGKEASGQLEDEDEGLFSTKEVFLAGSAWTSKETTDTDAAITGQNQEEFRRSLTKGAYEFRNFDPQSSKKTDGLEQTREAKEKKQMRLLEYQMQPGQKTGVGVPKSETNQSWQKPKNPYI